MNVKLLIVVLVLAAGGVGASYYSQMDSLKREVELKESANRRLEEQIKSSREKMEGDKRLISQWGVLNKRDTDLTAELTALKESRAQVVKQIFDACSTVRERGKEVEVPELTLPTGKSYTAVRLRKFGPTEVMITHSGGLVKIPVKELPPIWVKRFRLEDPIMTPPPAPVVVVTEAPPQAKAQQVQNDFQTSVARQNVRDLEGKIALIDTQIQNLEAAKSDAIVRAGQYRSQHVHSRIYGKIDSYMAEAQGMEIQAESYRQQIGQLRLRQTSLQNSLRDAQAAAMRP